MSDNLCAANCRPREIISLDQKRKYYQPAGFFVATTEYLDFKIYLFDIIMINITFPLRTNNLRRPMLWHISCSNTCGEITIRKRIVTGQITWARKGHIQFKTITPESSNIFSLPMLPCTPWFYLKFWTRI